MAHTRISISQSKSRRERWAGMISWIRRSDGVAGCGRRRLQQSRVGRLRDLRLGLGQPGLLVEVGLHYVAHDGRGELAVLAVLEQRRHHDLRDSRAARSRRTRRCPSCVCAV